MKNGPTHDCACSRPIKDTGTICFVCAEDAITNLTKLRWLLPELDVTASRQDRVGSGGGGSRGSSERPIPFNPRASKVRATIRAGLAGLAEDLHGDVRAATLRLHEQAERIAGDLRRWAEAGEKAIDLPPERRYAGTCGIEGCAQQLFANPWEPTVECRDCGSEHNVEEARDRMHAEIPDRLLTASEMETAVSWVAPVTVTAKEILKWRDTGRLFPHGESNRGGKLRPLYRIGDVLELVDARDERRRSRGRKASA